MKKRNFLRDENGAILILGVFALLLIGIGLLAISLDVPMTLNKESDAQVWLRKATAQASKEMQYTMYRCEAAQVSGLNVSPRPANYWQNCPPAGATGGLDFIQDNQTHIEARQYITTFLENNVAGSKTQEEQSFCIGGVSVRQNPRGEYYLYAYMDYPAYGLFDLTGQNPGQPCTCGTGTGLVNAPLTQGCKRVESGKLLTRKGELPFQIKTMFVVETSNSSAQNPQAVSAVGNTLDNVGEIMRNLGIGTP